MEGGTFQDLLVIGAAFAHTGMMDMQSTQEVALVLGWGGGLGPL